MLAYNLSPSAFALVDCVLLDEPRETSLGTESEIAAHRIRHCVDTSAADGEAPLPSAALSLPAPSPFGDITA
jgi:hypothetical protein